ncbi:hypothetical protein MTR_7g039490 [Medicago truncatula]|uniref:Uncharacterized protein n=1 Tax=Medicago truncatula TaxID=3880 RepID=A0A072U909_MEDTR|nr:hypothetical protein MTR_7g039490 [Medicago truncatula]
MKEKVPSMIYRVPTTYLIWKTVHDQLLPNTEDIFVGNGQASPITHKVKALLQTTQGSETKDFGLRT